MPPLEHSATLLTCSKRYDKNGIENQFLVFLRVAFLRRFYCVLFQEIKHIRSGFDKNQELHNVSVGVFLTARSFAAHIHKVCVKIIFRPTFRTLAPLITPAWAFY